MSQQTLWRGIKIALHAAHGTIKPLDDLFTEYTQKQNSLLPDSFLKVSYWEETYFVNTNGSINTSNSTRFTIINGTSIGKIFLYSKPN